MNIRIPEQAERIIDILTENGYAAYIVGGCVRDAILGSSPCDWDICTSASPDQTSKMLLENSFRVINTGFKHGTVTALTSDGNYEITTFRRDGLYSDHRRPDEVCFTDILSDDLSRRDFSINAMAYSHTVGLIDMFGGVDDLTARLVRAVGDADARFNEDALRILRALRFAAVLDFDIEEQTAVAIHTCKGLLKHISLERINSELTLLLAGLKSAVNIIPFLDVFIIIIQELRIFLEFKKSHEEDLWSFTLSSIAASPPDIIVRLTILLFNISEAVSAAGEEVGPWCPLSDSEDVVLFSPPPYRMKNDLCSYNKKPANLVRGILKALLFDNHTVDSVSELAGCCKETVTPDAIQIKQLLRRLGVEQFRRLLEIQRALELDEASIFPRSKKIASSRLDHLNYDHVLSVLNEIIDQKQCYSLKDLALSGEDLLSAGMSAGPQIGETLEGLLDAVIEQKVDNTREDLLTYIN